MTYKELSIHEKINVKSWVKHNMNEYLDKHFGKKVFEIVLIPHILIHQNTYNKSMLRCKDYPCTKETLLFRSNWKSLPENKSLFWPARYDTACSAWFDNMIRGF